MSNVVKYYLSTHENAPTISNGWGDLITLLDAVLVNGFNPKTITSITRSGTTATVTIGAGHAFAKYQVLLVAGADQSEYNGEHRVTGISGNTLTYEVTGTPVTPATGAITCKVAPLGFSKPFSGTNKAVYRSTNVSSNQPFLRVDHSKDANYTDTYAKSAKVTMAESMSGIDTFDVGGRAPYDWTAPTKNEVCTGTGVNSYNGWHKWYSGRIASSAESTGDGGAGARSWAIVGDDRGFYFHISPLTTVTGGYAGYCFNDFISFKSGDKYNTLLCAHDYYTLAGTGLGTYDVNNTYDKTMAYEGKILMRDYTQVGLPIRAGFGCLNPANAQVVSGNVASIPYPNGPDFGLVLAPVYLREEAGHVRGQMAGMYFIPQAVYATFPPFTIVDNVTAYPNKAFLLVPCSTGGTSNTRVAYDITGAWR